MDLEARDIHEKQFHDAWRGYNQEEVDDFLDSVAEVLDRSQRETRSLMARVRELEEQIEAGRNAEEVLKRTLVTAQKAAEEAIATARGKAEKLIAEAEQRSRRQADDAARRNDQAEKSHVARKRELDDAIARLKKHESEVKAKLKGFLEEQLRALDKLDSVARQSTPRPVSTEAAAPTERPAAPGVLRATPSRRSAEEGSEAPRRAETEEPSHRRRLRWGEGRR